MTEEIKNEDFSKSGKITCDLCENRQIFIYRYCNMCGKKMEIPWTATRPDSFKFSKIETRQKK